MFSHFRLLAVLFVSLVLLYGNGLSADTIKISTEVPTIQGTMPPEMETKSLLLQAP